MYLTFLQNNNRLTKLKSVKVYIVHVKSFMIFTGAYTLETVAKTGIIKFLTLWPKNLAMTHYYNKFSESIAALSKHLTDNCADRFDMQ